VWMWPPTHPSTCTSSPTHLPLPYPSSQLQLSASDTRGTSTMTGLQPVLPCLTMPNCKQSQLGYTRHTMLVWKTYDRYMSSLTPLMCSILPWTCLITQDNTHPSPIVRCCCPGSNTIQITLSISITSPMGWTWKTTNLCTFSPPQLTLRREGACHI
jgi:hypothetical protein